MRSTPGVLAHSATQSANHIAAAHGRASPQISGLKTVDRGETNGLTAGDQIYARNFREPQARSCDQRSTSELPPDTEKAAGWKCIEPARGFLYRKKEIIQ